MTGRPSLRLGRRLPVVLLLLLLLLLLVAACAAEPATRVLFIGNSYTATNDLPGMVRDLSDSAGHRLEMEAVAPGGWWLRDHAGSSDSMARIADGDFDFVVLQEQSMVPADRGLAESVSRPAAVSLALSAVDAGAQPVLFMTWGHRNGSGDVGHSSYHSMQIAIAATYQDLAAATTGRLAPVGAAWWMSLDERPDIVLYQADGSHPSAEGSYLAAAVIAGTILGVDPLSFDTSLGLDQETSAALRGFASRAVHGERPWR